MPITKRLTTAERMQKALGGVPWTNALGHRIIVSMSRSTAHPFPIDPESVSAAVARVKNGKGAHITDKVFVFMICSVMWRGLGASFLDDGVYNRLHQWLLDREEEILHEAGLAYHGAFVWDQRELRRFGKGKMPLRAWNAPIVRKRLPSHKKS